MPKRVLVISARMGAGHDGAARELCVRLQKRGHETQLVDFLDASPKMGRFLERAYELQLSKAPWTYEILYRLSTWTRALTPPVVFILGLFFERRLRQWAGEFKADLIVTTYPFASVVLGRARLKRRNRLPVPVTTYLTDFAAHPLWVHRGVDSHLCVHPRAAQAVYNLTGEFAKAPGPLVSAPFLDKNISKTEARRSLGIPLDVTAVLVVAGSWGVGELEKTFDDLIESDHLLPIVVCGRNELLAKRLKEKGIGIVLGWTDEMALYMRACDVVVQNAGGLTCMEAFASDLPVISYSPIPGHGRQNIFEMAAAGVARWARSPDSLRHAIKEVCEDPATVMQNARAMFRNDPAEEIERLLVGLTPKRILTPPKPRSRKYLGAVAAALMFFVSVNIIANIATDNGLNISPVSYASSRYVYVTVLVGPRNISASSVAKALSADNIAAIVTGKTAVAYPKAVAELANTGIAVIDGGWDSSADLHLITPDNAAAHTMQLLEDQTNENISIYAPQAAVNSVDLAWATLNHETIIRPTPLTPNTAKQPRFRAGQIYELNAFSITSSQLVSEISHLKSSLSNMHLKVSPIWTLR